MEKGILENYPELKKRFFPTKISRASMIQKIDCSKDSIKICNGICCTKKISGGRYFEEEYRQLPNNIKEKLIKVEPSKKDVAYHEPYDYRIKKEGDTCPFVSICLERPELKPLQCRLFPFRISTKGKLYVQRWAWLHCPNRNKGNGVWISMEDDLRYIFGDKFYEKLKIFMKSDLPDDEFKTLYLEELDI